MGKPLPASEVFDKGGFDDMLDKEIRDYEDLSLTTNYAEARVVRARALGRQEGLEAAGQFGE